MVLRSKSNSVLTQLERENLFWNSRSTITASAIEVLMAQTVVLRTVVLLTVVPGKTEDPYLIPYSLNIDKYWKGGLLTLAGREWVANSVIMPFSGNWGSSKPN